uniref:Zinc finger CCCH domain-containing protein 62 n=1 Tax=Kalanchoe fedtschenkoi TaxID=63787 RepID=A0A7N0TYQ6_KALFE
MAFAEHLGADRRPDGVVDGEDGDTERDFTEEEDSDLSVSDDSVDDPTFNELEETMSGLSKLSVQKKKASSSSSSARGRRLESELVEAVDMDVGDDELLEEVDRNSFEAVEGLIRGGKLEKLKIEQCKVYLRKYGLRLTGNKETLIKRISEHIRILNGGGEREYPAYSFVLNCKGDACMGDVVMFEQKVYAAYDLAARSGPPIGTRVIAGRIVKESYGAAKQQHTFTIEVLWSRGEKPLPPLHPLLIKGRNLYKMKTLRQRWEDETLREQALRDKHLRGAAARTDREMRIREKKMRRELRAKRVPRTDKYDKDHAPPILPQNNNKKHPLAAHDNQAMNQPDATESRNIMGQQRNQSAPQQKSQVQYSGMDSTHHPHNRSVRGRGPAHGGFENENSRLHPGSFQNVHNQQNGTTEVMRRYHGAARRPLAAHAHQPPLSSRENIECPARSFSPPAGPRFSQQVRGNHHQHPPRQPCWYFAEGRCRFGSNCKFSHG